VSDHQAGKEDILRLSLSTEQSRLIRRTWASAAANTAVRRPDSETLGQTPSLTHSRRRHAGRGGAAEAEAMAMAFITPMCPDDNSIFREIKNIEKVCIAVDKRIEQRRAQKEWTTRVVAETARLRDEDDSDGEDGRDDGHANSNSADSESRRVHVDVERSPSYRPPRSHIEAHVAEVDHRLDLDDYNVGRLGVTRTESTHEVPTSQSQERYIVSPSA
jgi:hypothetical protein